MDNKDSLFRAIFAAAVVFIIWNMISTTYYLPDNANTAPSDPVDLAMADIPVHIGDAFDPPADEELGAEEIIDLGNAEDALDSEYRMHLQLTNRGAAVQNVRLTEHLAEVGTDELYYLMKPLKVGAKTHYSFLTPRVGIQCEGKVQTTRLDNVLWRADHDSTADAQVARFTYDIKDESGADRLRLVKTFRLAKPIDEDDRRSDIEIALSFTNLSDKALGVTIEQLGPVGVTKADPRMDYRRVTQGYVAPGPIATEQLENTDLEDEHTFQNTNVRWVALANKFFAVIMAPRLKNKDDASWLAPVRAMRLNSKDAESVEATFRLTTREFAVPPDPQSSVTLAFDCFIGPKSKKLFRAVPEYAANNYVELINRDYYMCAWTAVVNVMLWLLNTVHSVWPNNYGLAIIVMVLIVRTLLHPLTKKGQVNMTRMAEQMGKLQPKLEALKEKYGNDKNKLHQETMKFYQQEGINPAGQMFTCLPMMCQLPIWAGLWAALQHTVELRHQPFCLWITDLTSPDAFYTFAQELPLIGTTFNLLPPLLGVSMWLQHKFMPKPAQAVRRDGKGPDQMAQQRIMMSIMSVMMVFFFYSAPSGLTLYIMASNFFGLLEQYFIRKHIKQEREKGGGTMPTKKPRFGKPKFIKRLEQMAEEARQQKQKSR
jgi:YidC/Oxa1 family membrane protein insertase